MLHPDALKMLCFINPESDGNPDTRPRSEIARSTIFKTHPDGLCISANAAGQDVDDALIASGSCPKFGFNRYVFTTQLKTPSFRCF